MMTLTGIRFWRMVLAMLRASFELLMESAQVPNAHGGGTR
jgi:hypothetical protein